MSTFADFLLILMSTLLIVIIFPLLSKHKLQRQTVDETVFLDFNEDH